ncbi:MAG: hypothetical protein ACK5FE_11585 [Cyanobacteriota bacterium]|jgi:hypothetical protein
MPPFHRAASACAASALIGAALARPARAYDLQYRQNGTSFSAGELRRIFNNALPAAYDQSFPDQRWTTYLLLDAHADQSLVAISLGLSPRVVPSQALLPVVATFSVIEPCPARRSNGTNGSRIWRLAMPR